MKFIIIILLSAPLFFLSTTCLSQTSGPSTATQLAAKHADRMRDSLGLNNSERQRVYDANIYLQNCKSQAWTRYANDPTRLQHELQSIENKRDSIYNSILGSNEKFQLYKSKKLNIIKSN